MVQESGLRPRTASPGPARTNPICISAFKAHNGAIIFFLGRKKKNSLHIQRYSPLSAITVLLLKFFRSEKIRVNSNQEAMDSGKTISLGGRVDDPLRYGIHGVKSDIIEPHPLESAYHSVIFFYDLLDFSCSACLISHVDFGLLMNRRRRAKKTLRRKYWRILTEERFRWRWSSIARFSPSLCSPSCQFWVSLVYIILEFVFTVCTVNCRI